MDKKPLTDREKRIEELRKKEGITRAHAASIVDAEEAAKNRKAPDKEETEKESAKFIAPESVVPAEEGAQ